MSDVITFFLKEFNTSNLHFAYESVSSTDKWLLWTVTNDQDWSRFYSALCS